MMNTYGIKYHVRGCENKVIDTLVNARDERVAKKKIGRSYGYRDGRMIVIHECKVVGYT